MRYVLRGDGPIKGWFENIALWLNLVPGPFLFTTHLGMGGARSFIAAARLGVFEALAGRPLAAPEVAAKIACDPHATEALLNALNGFGWLRRRDGVYRLTGQIRRWYLPGSPVSLRDAALFMGDLWDLMGHFEEDIRTGRPANFHHAGLAPEFWRNYERALASFGRVVAPLVARRVKFASPPRRLLDVGGGHGTYAMEMARRHPGLAADVLDLPAAADQGRLIVAERGMTDRVNFIEADLRAGAWGADYDAALLFNLIHTLTPEEALAAIRSARAALRPGGQLVVMDGDHRGGRGDLGQNAGYLELFFFMISGGARAYSDKQIAAWMREAGFKKVKISSLYAMPGVMLLIAE